MSANLQPIGRAFALVQPANERTALTSEPVKSTEEQVEIIKVGFFVFSLVFFLLLVLNQYIHSCMSLFQVYLEARKKEQQKHQESLKMLSDEVSQIQEVSVWTASNWLFH